MLILTFGEYFQSKQLDEVDDSFPVEEYVDDSFPVEEYDDMFPVEDGDDREGVVGSVIGDLVANYSDNEAVNSIEVQSDDDGEFVQFNVKCETDVELSATEYNGVRLKYNHVCGIEDRKDSIEDRIAVLLDSNPDMNFRLRPSGDGSFVASVYASGGEYVNSSGSIPLEGVVDFFEGVINNLK